MRPQFPPGWPQPRPVPVVSPDETRTDACGMCGKPLDPKAKSPFFCTASCQDLWHRSRSEAIPWTTTPADDNAMAERIRSRWGLPDPGKDVA